MPEVGKVSLQLTLSSKPSLLPITSLSFYNSRYFHDSAAFSNSFTASTLFSSQTFPSRNFLFSFPLHIFSKRFRNPSTTSTNISLVFPSTAQNFPRNLHDPTSRAQFISIQLTSTSKLDYNDVIRTCTKESEL
jgi:hypothetical protein